MTLPEGLRADIDDNTGCIYIRDAQDVQWVEITTGGVGDPDEWQSNIAHTILLALGIDTVGDQPLLSLPEDNSCPKP